MTANWTDAELESIVPARTRNLAKNPNKATSITITAALGANENPLGASPAAVSAIAKAAERSHRYPDGDATALRAEIFLATAHIPRGA